MKQIIAVINQKGGVAKTTTTHALGTGLIQESKKVLFIDMDAQANLTYSVGIDKPRHTITDVLSGKIGADKAITHTENGDIIPADISLAGADQILKETGKEFKLKEALECVYSKYDYIVIDTPPALGILTVNALAAATGLVIPAQADDFSLQGIAQLYNTINTVKRYCNQNLTVWGILLTRHNNRSVLNRDMASTMEEAAKEVGTIVFETSIRECVALKEAQAMQQSIYEYSPKSNAAIDYKAFIQELLGVMK